MSRGQRRDLVPAFVLHQRPWRDTSRVIDVFTRGDGRIVLFARGVRQGKRGLASLLQPFRPLLISYGMRGDAGWLGAVEPAADERFASPSLPAAHVMSGFYLSELVLKLTTREDPQPTLYDDYAHALAGLGAGAPAAQTLRVFEKRLLETLGYGVDLESEAGSGRALDPDGLYVFRPAQGLTRAVADAPGAVSGRAVLGLANESFAEPGDVDAARRVLRAALDHCLEGRALATRAVARAIAGREPRP